MMDEEPIQAGLTSGAIAPLTVRGADPAGFDGATWDLHYGLLGLAVAIFSAACASTGHAPTPFPTPTSRPDAGTVTQERAGHDQPPQVATALALRGSPYRHGGADPNGFDCSGFTQYVFARHGVALPRDTREQFRAGKRVKKSDVTSGDLVFFSTVTPGASHVAIAIDGDRFVHAPSSTGAVRVERMSLPYWEHRFVGARRLEGTPIDSRPERR